jgi:pimeloyl-ACP methyl ester carboxylesterase
VTAPDGIQTSERTVDLGSATIRYREAGAGPPVVFVHGLLVDGSIWDRVVPAVVAGGHRCLVPDWPLGAHRIPVPDADLTPPGVAHLVAEFIEALGLDDVTIVANDHDLRRFVAAIDPRHTMAAAARLGSFSGPVLLVWASEDKVFLPSLAERLAGALSRPTLTWVADSYAFVPLDQPEVLARRVVDFLGAGTQTQSG